MILFSIIGALIGAGFASGQEIYIFFYKYGIYGIIGLTICCICISLTIYKTLLIVKNKNITSYQDFLKIIFRKRNKNYLNLSYISNIIINTFLLITFYIMIAGFGAYFEQQFGIKKEFGACILAMISCFILLKDIKGVTKVNSVIVPVLIIIIMTISVINLKNINISELNKETSYKWIIQSIIYLSYNMILVIPVIVELGKYIKSNKQIENIAILCGIIVFMLAISIFLILINTKTDLDKIQMPVVYIISEKFPNLKVIYGIVILLSIFSTAISIGLSFAKNITKNKNNYPQIVALMCITSIIISKIGFSNLVKIMFPVFGYIGIIELIYLMKTPI